MNSVHILFNVWFIVTIVTVPILVSSISAENPDDLILSKKIDFVFLKAYDIAFSVYYGIEMHEKANQKLDEELGKFDEGDLPGQQLRVLRKHYIYANYLGKNGSSLTELFIALYVKFLAFVNVVDYMNCEIYKGNDSILKTNPCVAVSKHLFLFSYFGLEEISERISLILKPLISNTAGNEILNGIENMVEAIPKFIRLYVNGRSKPERNYVFFKRNRDEIFYRDLCDSEYIYIGAVIEQMRRIFESIKFGPEVASLIRFQESLTLPFNEAEDLWIRANVVYKRIYNMMLYGDDHYISHIIRDTEIRKLEIMGAFGGSNEEDIKNKLRSTRSEIIQIYFHLKDPMSTMFENSLFFTSKSFTQYNKTFVFRENILDDPRLHVSEDNRTDDVNVTQPSTNAPLEESSIDITSIPAHPVIRLDQPNLSKQSQSKTSIAEDSNTSISNEDSVIEI